MATQSKIILIILLSCFLSSGICAKETFYDKTSGKEMLEFTMPEIVVKGDNSLTSLRSDVIRAEKLKFEVFNKLNSTDDYDITCEWRAPTGSRIKRWGCNVGYIKKAQERDVLLFLMGFINHPRRIEFLAAEYAGKTRKLNKEMKALAIQYPELALAMINAHEMQQYFRGERHKRFKNNIFTGSPKPNLLLNKIAIWEAVFKDHRNGKLSDEIWGRWDSIYKKIFRYKSYQKLWESTKTQKYDDAFVAYVNEIISGK